MDASDPGHSSGHSIRLEYTFVLDKPPSLQEVIAVVNKARAKSAPGPNGVPYQLYKRCPNVLKKLHKILRSAWKNIKISKEWMTAEGVYIPKEKDSRE
ncbi:polyprotein [Plakobranchus ocellatus]|uniref:Polyprotein n=1 Tax=Plakobranchus ocellatus TaxID=259542 RepID=A0AAV4A0T8_9GAST|nr:polyprotein [Plakobranchus ocellatus]